MMIDRRLTRMAGVLIDYSTGVKKGDIVFIKGSSLAEPLIKELYRLTLERGGHPHIRVSLPGQPRLYYETASGEELRYLSPVSLYEARKADVYISISSASNTRSLSGIDPAKQAAHGITMKPVSETILRKSRWTITLFPTEAYAQDADMSLPEFEDFVFKAVFADKSDPVGAWKKLAKMQDALIKNLRGADEVRIVSSDTDLTLSVKGRTFVNSCGKHNMPSGEIFTGPVENSANGWISFSYPVCYGGREVDGVRLRFKDGKMIKAEARKNEAFLKSMLGMDRGARYLGEFAFATNRGIQKFTKSILFDEKIGGTIHLALGRSYPETGGKNKSALHWDMIKDLRKEGEIYVNGKLFMKKGRFTA